MTSMRGVLRMDIIPSLAFRPEIAMLRHGSSSRSLPSFLLSSGILPTGVTDVNGPFSVEGYTARRPELYAVDQTTAALDGLVLGDFK